MSPTDSDLKLLSLLAVNMDMPMPSASDCSACPVMNRYPLAAWVPSHGYEAIEPTGELPAVSVTVPGSFAISPTEVTRDRAGPSKRDRLPD